MAYNSCVTYFSKSHWYSNSSALHQGCTKYNQMGLQKNQQKLRNNKKESDMLRSPMNSLFNCFNTSVLLRFLVQSWWRKELKCQCSLLPCSLPKAIEITTKIFPVSLWRLPSWLTLKWCVKGIDGISLSTF